MGIGASQTLRSAMSARIGLAALVVGLTTVVLGVAMHSPTTGRAVTIALGGLIALVAVWSLLAVDPTYDFLTLAISGFALLLSPWLGGFVADPTAGTAWVAGVLATALGVGGYLCGERLNFTNRSTKNEGGIHV